MNPLRRIGVSKRKARKRRDKRTTAWFLVVSAHHHFSGDNISAFWKELDTALNDNPATLRLFHQVAKHVKEQDRRIVTP